VWAVCRHFHSTISVVAVLAHAFRVIFGVFVIAGRNFTDIFFLPSRLSKLDKLFQLVESQLGLFGLRSQIGTLRFR